MPLTFDDSAKRALDAVWGVAVGVDPYTGVEPDIPTAELRERLRRLEGLALRTALHGARLLGHRNPDERLGLETSLASLSGDVDELINASAMSTDFAELDFVGRVCDVHREVVALGFLD